MSELVKAVRSAEKLRMSISGPPGSGKTYTALSIASGMGSTVLLADTEHRSSRKYADLFDFYVLDINPPYKPAKIPNAVKYAVDHGVDVLIIDSLTHFWKGEGGVLDLVDEKAASMRTSNTFAAWKEGSKVQDRDVVSALLAAPAHVIVCMRSKMAHEQERDEKGKLQVRKLGMAPEQRDGIEYEFDLCVDMDHDHNMVVTKTRYLGLQDRVVRCPDKAVGERLAKWLAGSEAAAE